MRIVLTILLNIFIIKAFAQIADHAPLHSFASPEPTTFTVDHWNPMWFNMQGAFLEPNRFAVVYDRSPRRLRLEAGYGEKFIQIDKTTVGGEILIWSGLKTLNGFRFPVETADYFFGLYSIFPIGDEGWNEPGYEPLKGRVRISHISSHFVDGTQDSVIGGASSRFSREFLSVEALLNRYAGDGFVLSGGVKYVFHQVVNSEPTFQFPLCFHYALKDLSPTTSVYSYLSSSAGPSLPSYSIGIVFRQSTSLDRGLEIYGEYHTGRSRYGVEVENNQSGFELGLRICELPWE